MPSIRDSAYSRTSTVRKHAVLFARGHAYCQMRMAASHIIMTAAFISDLYKDTSVNNRQPRRTVPRKAAARNTSEMTRNEAGRVYHF